MSRPILLVIAGCNGSGKSSFSGWLAEGDFQPFDYDIHYLSHYRSLFDSDVRDIMAHNLAFSDLENGVQSAIENIANFCYETNFNSTPLHWPERFIQHGYELRLIYLCMDSVAEAKKRVAIRVENGGHFVPSDEIEKRYHDGFGNLNKYYAYFDKVDLFDTSGYGHPPKHILSVENHVMVKRSFVRSYLKGLIPNILALH